MLGTGRRGRAALKAHVILQVILQKIFTGDARKFEREHIAAHIACAVCASRCAFIQINRLQQSANPVVGSSLAVFLRIYARCARLERPGQIARPNGKVQVDLGRAEHFGFHRFALACIALHRFGGWYPVYAIGQFLPAKKVNRARACIAIGAAAPTLQIIVVKFGNFYEAHKFDDIAKMWVDRPAKYVHAVFGFV